MIENDYRKILKLSACLDLFYLDAESRLHDTTIQNYRNKLKIFIEYLESVYGSKEQILITQITSSDIKLFQKHLRSRIKFEGHPFSPVTTDKISNNTIRDYCSKALMFFKFCYNNDYIEFDITKKIKLIKGEDKDTLPLFASEVKDLDKLFSHRSETDYRNLCIIHMMLDAGMRASEVTRIKVSDINFDKGYLYVDKSKGYKSRYVRMSTRLKTILLKYKTLYRFPGYNTDTFLFQIASANPINYNCVKMVFERAKKQLDIPRLKPHLLRHTFASSFLLGGGNLESLRVLLGHSNIATTQKYVHVATQYKSLADDIYQLDHKFLDIYYHKFQE